MGVIVTYSYENIAVSAIQDLFELTLPATVAAILHEVHVTQRSDTDSEQWPVQIKRGVGSTTSGTGGSSANINANSNTPGITPNATAERNNTSQASAGSGTLVTLETVSENVLNGRQHLPVPEDRYEFPGGGRIIVAAPVAPADAITVDFKMVVEFIGGI